MVARGGRCRGYHKPGPGASLSRVHYTARNTKLPEPCPLGPDMPINMGKQRSDSPTRCSPSRCHLLADGKICESVTLDTQEVRNPGSTGSKIWSRTGSGAVTKPFPRNGGVGWVQNTSIAISAQSETCQLERKFRVAPTYQTKESSSQDIVNNN